MTAWSIQRSFILPYRYHPASSFDPVFAPPPCADFFCIEIPDFSERRIYGNFCAEYIFAGRAFAETHICFGESWDQASGMVYRAAGIPTRPVAPSVSPRLSTVAHTAAWGHCTYEQGRTHAGSTSTLWLRSMGRKRHHLPMRSPPIAHTPGIA